MASRIDPGLHREIARFGATDLTACMNCGHCTATCSLATEAESFPRRIIHLLQVGHREQLAQAIEPWLCYYCGECSESCPRDANPGEIMMATRRYLTGLYDWTGLGRRFYLSPALQISAMGLIGGLVVLLFALFHGPVVTDHVALNTFAPVKVIELADWILAATLGSLLISNAWRMWSFVMADAPRPSWALLMKEGRTLLIHFFTQKRWSGCTTERTRWLKHLLLVSGYVTMMVLVIIGLRWFQTDEVRPFWHPTRLLGYFATVALLYVTADFFVGRVRASAPIHKKSETSDWLFVALLFLAALTGILVHVLRLSSEPLATYVTYVVHLAVVTPLLVVEVPFGKWSHMLYRPLAIYLAAVRQKLPQSAANVAA
jgi:quinone-modifying oxidoreductase subunit QmoC